MEINRLSDFELAQRIIRYIKRADDLQHRISKYLQTVPRSWQEADEIKAEYRQLKYEIKADYEYVSKSRNEQGSELYAGVFSESIKEAYANGFGWPVNGRVCHEMYSAVEEAHYRLRKIYSLDRWKNIV